LPETARLLGTPVLTRVPWLKSPAMVAMLTPVPTCIGVTVEELLPEFETPFSVLLKLSSKLTFELLKPVVLTLAMLLPMTSSCWLKPCIALTPVESESSSAMVVRWFKVGWWWWEW